VSKLGTDNGDDGDPVDSVDRLIKLLFVDRVSGQIRLKDQRRVDTSQVRKVEESCGGRGRTDRASQRETDL